MLSIVWGIGLRMQQQFFQQTTKSAHFQRLQGTPLAGLPLRQQGCRTKVAQQGFAVGGIPEVVTPASGLLVVPRDVVALAEALTNVLARDWNRDEIRRAVKTGTWMENAAQLASVIQGDEKV